MMKNRKYLRTKRRHSIGIPLLMLSLSVLLAPKLKAVTDEIYSNSNFEITPEKIKPPQKNSIVTVSGYVSCKGKIISGVVVQSEATGDETLTDSEGDFTINVKNGSTLIFKKSGYKPYDYNVHESQENLIVCLMPEDESTESDFQESAKSQEETENVVIIQTKNEYKDSVKKLREIELREE